MNGKNQPTTFNEKGSNKKNLIDDGNRKNRYTNMDLIDIYQVLCQEQMLCANPSIYLNVLNN